MNDNHILLASRYVEGELEPQELTDFELLLQGDAELRNYVQLYREAETALGNRLRPDPALDSLKLTLSTLNQQYFKDEPEAKVVSFKPYLRWVSGVAAVLVISLLVYLPLRKSLYEEYSTATTMSVTERGAGGQTNLEKAAAFYNKKDFPSAEKLLAGEYLQDPKNSLVAYYYSITLIEDKQTTKARQLLQQLYAGESAFKYDAAYYTALSYLKDSDKTNCKVWLAKVPAGTSNYQKAVELKKKLQ